MNKAALLIPATLLFSLSGCFLTGGGGPGSTPDPDGSAAGDDLAGGAIGCLSGKDWHLDVGDAATQIGDYLGDNGLNVTGSVGTGDQSFRFEEDGAATSSTDLTYTITIDMGDGLTMVMAQHHVGTPGGEWAWNGDADSTLVFNNWDGDYTVTTDLTINGQAAPSSVSPPTGGLDGQAMTVSCDGDTLHTQAEGSPFAQTWHAS